MITSGNTPLSVGTVTLTVNDLDATRDYYRRAVGLEEISGDREASTLGAADGRPLLTLRRDGAARRRSRSEAGLFHTAFLLPARSDLGRWTKHAIETRTPVLGASDHGVSEAVYLSDPEGNGVEIYADRPPEQWRRVGDMIEMPSDPLDFADLVASAGDGVWSGAPAGSIVGHVHLQVGAIPPAEGFYHDLLGLDVTFRYHGASFFGSGGYHHHLAANTWNSRGAVPRGDVATGLRSVELLADAGTLAGIRGRAEAAGIAAKSEAGGLLLRDPNGVSLTVVEKAG